MKKTFKESLILFKRITAVALTLLMVAGIISIPEKTKAANTGSKVYSDDYDLHDADVFLPGDRIELSNGYLSIYYLYGDNISFNFYQFDNSCWGGNEPVIANEMYSAFEDDIFYEYYYDASFVFPNYPGEKESGSYVYVNQSFNPVYKKYIDGEVIGSDDSRWESPEAVPMAILELYVYEGFKVLFCNNDNEQLNPDDLNYVYKGNETSVYESYDAGPYLSDSSNLGPFIGWSNNPDYIDMRYTPNDLYYKTSYIINKWNFGRSYQLSQDGVLRLYPVYERAESKLIVEIDDFWEGGTPVIKIVETNRPEDAREYTVSYEKFINSDKTEPISGIPHEPGEYRAIITMPEYGELTTSIYESGTYIESRGFSAVSTSADFTILGDSKIIESPAGKELTYNGTEQELITAGEAFGGNFIYSLDPEGDFIPEIPTAKNAGGYTVWYMLSGTEGRSDIGPLSVEADISPKTVAFTWSDTVFKYDGKSHVPTVTVTGLIEGDVCDATVVGGESEIGTHTAYVSALSNSNYMIPEESSVTYKIEEKPVPVIKSAPAALSPTYSNINQKLVSYGEVEHGTMLYSLEKDGKYSLSVPTGKDAGTYTVWYKVEGDDGWKDIAPMSLSAQISKRATDISWSEEEFIYDGKPHCPKATATGVLKGDICTVSVSGGGTDAGLYYATAEGLSNANYVLSGSVEKAFTINPKTVGLIWTDTKFVFDFEEHCPAAKITGICEGDTCTVTVTGAGKEIGKHTATAKALSNSNYSLPTDVSKEFEIVKPDKKIGSATVSMKGYNYGGKASTPIVKSPTNETSKVTYYYKHTDKPDSSYRAGFPTEVGEYTLKAVLPENDDYIACVATTDFTVSYLPVPDNAYTISGKKGNNGWYVSDVEITPATGYEISYGDRNHYSGYPIKLEDTVSVCYIFIKDTRTGEQTSMISVGNFNIDSDAPNVIGMNLNGLYFADQSGLVKVLVKDDNILKVLVEGEEAALTKAENGSMSFMIKAGKKKEKTSFAIYDLAGNKTDFAVITAPYWAESGELIEGDLYLEGDEMYSFPEGVWTVNGDSTRYYGGTTFYVVTEGDYTLQKITD